MTIDELRDQPEERVITRIVIPSHAFKPKQPTRDSDDDGND